MGFGGQLGKSKLGQFELGRLALGGGDDAAFVVGVALISAEEGGPYPDDGGTAVGTGLLTAEEIYVKYPRTLFAGNVPVLVGARIITVTEA